MALAKRLAHLARRGTGTGMGKRASGVIARARRFTPVLVLSLLGLVLMAGGFYAAQASGPVHGGHAGTETKVAGSKHHGASSFAVASTLGNRALAGEAKAVSLPVATAAPVAAPAALVSAPPMAERENFAFAPYWTLGQSPTFSLTGLSTLAYFSIGVNPDGTLDESGPGWNGYQSQDLSDLITRAHAANERVVLTVNDFGQSSLNSLTSSATAPTTLAKALIPLLTAKNLDGVNFDFEGTGSGDQAGLTNLITAVSGSLRAADPHWQVTMDTYASSAGDPGGFYNIAALAPAVDAFFVMAYELNLGSSASPVSPLTSGMFSDLTTLTQYTSVVPASKVILGAPFFGIDWPTNNGTLEAVATGAAADIADAQVQSSTEPQYWDPATSTGWTSYLVGTQWHESYFENAFGLFDVAKLVAHFGARGVGIWALGMEQDGPQMISALDGFAPPGSPGSTGPQATSTSPAAGSPGSTVTTTTAASGGSTGTTSSTATPSSTSTTKPGPSTTTTTATPFIKAEYNGTTKFLGAWAPGSVTPGASAGTITNFDTNEPAYSCLNGKTLSVYFVGLFTSGKYVAVAASPGDCMNEEFTF
jgi:spore germination protein